jgi:hypothetical protein
MMEEWLVRLANQIKEKERKGAEEAANSRRRIELLKQRGPAFWKSFSEALQENMMALRNLLEGDVTLAEGPLNFRFDASTLEIGLAKTGFPIVQFTAIPRFDREIAEITYLSAGGNGQVSSMNCQFQIGSDGRLTMRLDGRAFSNPVDAATFVMERLFRITTTRRLESQDSHIGHVGSE